MPKVCAVPGCSEKPVIGSPVSFHGFPISSDLRKKWIDSLGIKTSITKSAGVCSKHFNQEDFIGFQERRKLRQNVIPTLSPKSVSDAPLQQVPEIILPDNSKHSAIVHTLNFCHWGGGIQHVVLTDSPQETKEETTKQPDQGSKLGQRFIYSKEVMSQQLEKKKIHIQQVSRKLKAERTKNARLKARVQVLQEVINKLKDNIDPSSVILNVNEEGHVETISTR